MKKVVMAGLACIAAFSMSLPVSAHEPYHCGGQNCAENYCFIDEDGDGICDNSWCMVTNNIRQTKVKCYAEDSPAA